MAEISSYGRGQKNPPKVPVKVSSAIPYTTDVRKIPQNNGFTTVDSNGRTIAKPRIALKSQGSVEQKVGILLPCFGEYKAQNACNQKSSRPDVHPADSRDAVNVVSPMATSKAQPPLTPSIVKNEDKSKRSPISPPSGKQINDKVLYEVPIRTDQPKLPATKGTPGTYRLLTPPPLVIGNPPRKSARPPKVNLDKFKGPSAPGNLSFKDENLSAHQMEDRLSTEYEEYIYEVA